MFSRFVEILECIVSTVIVQKNLNFYTEKASMRPYDESIQTPYNIEHFHAFILCLSLPNTLVGVLLGFYGKKQVCDYKVFNKILCLRGLINCIAQVKTFISPKMYEVICSGQGVMKFSAHQRDIFMTLKGGEGDKK